MNWAILPRLCELAADLARDRQPRLSPDERQALDSFFRMGLLEVVPGSDLCRCHHPQLFAFRFYHCWLPRHIEQFRPTRMGTEDQASASSCSAASKLS